MPPFEYPGFRSPTEQPCPAQGLPNCLRSPREPRRSNGQVRERAAKSEDDGLRLLDGASIEHLAKGAFGRTRVEPERTGRSEEGEGAVHVDDGESFGPRGERAIDRIAHVVDDDRVAIQGEFLHALRRTNGPRGFTDRFVQHSPARHRHRPIAVTWMGFLHVNQHEVRAAPVSLSNLFQPTGCFTERGSSPRSEDQEDRPLSFRIRDPDVTAPVGAGHAKVRHGFAHDHARPSAFHHSGRAA